VGRFAPRLLQRRHLKRKEDQWLRSKCVFVVSSEPLILRLKSRVLFLLYQCLGNAATFYNEASGEFPMISSVAFSNGIPIPIRNINNEVSRAVGHALATETAVRRQTGCEREFLFLRVRHFGNCLKTLANNAMTSRARTNTATCMIDLDAMRQPDVENAPGQARVTIRDLFRIHFDRHIHGKKGNREFLRRWRSRFLIDVRIRTTHVDMVPLFDYD
jgi:hypothetical protein